MKTKLFGRYKIEAINAYAVPVITYTAGVVKWTTEEMSVLNRDTRKILNMYGALHPRADVDRLYLPRKIGGRGLKDISDTIECERRSLTEYIWNNENDPLLRIVRKGGVYPRKTEEVTEWKRKTEEEKENRWKQKPLHGFLRVYYYFFFFFFFLFFLFFSKKKKIGGP